jgi:hypothetical protein
MLKSAAAVMLGFSTLAEHWLMFGNATSLEVPLLPLALLTVLLLSVLLLLLLPLLLPLPGVF